MRGRSRSHARVDAGAVSPVAACKSSASVDDVSLPINRGSDVCEAVTGAFDGACDCARDGSVPTCSHHPAAAAASPLLIRRSASAIIFFRCRFLSCLSYYEHSICCVYFCGKNNRWRATVCDNSGGLRQEYLCMPWPRRCVWLSQRSASRVCSARRGGREDYGGSYSRGWFDLSVISADET